MKAMIISYKYPPPRTARGTGTAPLPVLMAVLVILLLATSLLRAALADFSPEFYFYLACGAASSVSFPSDSPARTFVPDSAYLSPSPSPAPAAYPSASNPTPASPLYAAARTDSSAFSYRFPYLASQDASSFVVLRLHFFPFVAASSQPVTSLFSARFNVSVLDDAYNLLSSFSPPTAGVVKEFFVPRGGYGKDRPTMGEVVWNLEFCLQLQETHVNRDAFEDSGAVPTQLPSDVAVPRPVPSSTSLLMDEADETVVSMTDLADSQVFSQLDAHGKGR